MRFPREIRRQSSVRLLRDDVDVDGGSVLEEPADGVHVEKLLPTFDSGAAEDHLRDMLLADEFRGGVWRAASLQAHGRGAKAFGELQIRGERFFVLAVRAVAGIGV